MKRFVVLLAFCAGCLVSSAAPADSAARLLGKVPSGSTYVVGVDAPSLLASRFYSEASKRLPELAGMVANFEGYSRLPVKNCQYVLVFGNADGKTGGVLVELKNLDEAAFLMRLQPEKERLTVTEHARGKIYTLAPSNTMNAGIPHASFIFLEPNVLLVSEKDKIVPLLALAALTPEARAELVPSVPDKAVAFSGMSGLNAAKKKKKKNDPVDVGPVTRRMETLQSQLRFTGADLGLRLDADARFREEKHVGSALLQLNGVMFLGCALLFAENQELGQQLLQKIALTPKGRTLSGKLELDNDTAVKVLDYAGTQLRKHLLAPEADDVAGPNAPVKLSGGKTE